MAVTKTPRFQLDQWSEGGDPRPGRVDTNRIHQLIETQAAKVFPSGLLSKRPASNTFGSFFLATDQGVEGRLYYNGGSGWVALNTVGGGGQGKPVVINGTGGEGSSLLAARADHTHAIPLATRDNAGAMASQWAELMENATSSATAGALAIRDSGGRLTAQLPTSAQHVATKDYVDNAGSSGPFAGLAARSSSGQLSVANPTAGVHAVNKEYVDSRIYPVSQNAVGSTVMRRWGSGEGAAINDPTTPLACANKRYVDSRASRREWKTNIRENPYGLEEILQVDTYLYDYKDGAPAVGNDELGPMVDELARVMPLLTTDGDDGAPERVIDRRFIPVLIQAVQELSRRVDELSTELEDCYNRVSGDDDA